MPKDPHEQLIRLYHLRKQIVAAMAATGHCSSEFAKRQQQAFDFAIKRETQIILAGNREENSRWSRFFNSTLLNFVGFAFLLTGLFHFALAIHWAPAAWLALLGTGVFYKLERLEEISANSRRLIDVSIYSLAHLVAQRDQLSLYEARSKVEYMYDPEIEFESELLDEDLTAAFYEVSYACAQGRCNECNGMCGDYSNSSGILWQDSRPHILCLHNCHRTAKA